MKKIDLHLHTVSTPSDRNFSFSIERLKWYVEEGNLDAIAITNHNMFDLNQFYEIQEKLSIKVFPGIEIDVEGTHILLIAEDDQLLDFSEKCQLVKEQIPDRNTSINVEKLKEIFPRISDYLLIPHYKKSPEIHTDTLSKLQHLISAGEVSSARKFIYCIKDPDALVPVCFSDLRIEERLHKIPARQTYINVGEISLKSVKQALTDKQKVHLSKEEGHKFFNALNNGLKLSTGLNVILGERSSGKSHTLNSIEEENTTDDIRVKYVRQFSLLQKDLDDEKDFSNRLTTSQSQITQNYLKEFQEVVDKIKDIDLDNSSRTLDNFVNSLLKHASEADKLDSFAKVKLFTESKFQINNLLSLKELIKASITLADNSEYQHIINKHISSDNLNFLTVDLIEKYNKNKESELQKAYVNDIVDNIKSELQMRTAASPVTEINLYEHVLDIEKVSKFNDVVENLKISKEFIRQDIQGFLKVAKRGTFNFARELGAVLNKQISFANAFKSYDISGYEYLSELKKISGLSETDYYKHFAKISYDILNSSGYTVSGGERSEYRLLQEISDASQYDLLLIDEPESSFDNVFLYNKVNKLIKEMSKFMPVIIVTHNSTVGASIKPDYLIYTSKKNGTTGVQYEIYTGYPNDKYLVNLDGDKTHNHKVLLDCLEAGKTPYLTRRDEYEMLAD